MAVELSTKSSDVNEMEEENLNPSRENKKIRNREGTSDTYKILCAAEHTEGTKVVLLNFTVLNRPLPERLFPFYCVTHSRISAKFLQNTSISTANKKSMGASTFS